MIDFIVIIFKSEDAFDEEYNYKYIHANNHQQQQFYQQPKQPQDTPPRQPAQQPKNDFSSKTDKLKDLKALLDAGVLTQEEFDSEKKKILDS